MLYCLWANTQLPGRSETTETGAQSKQRHRGPLLSCTTLHISTSSRHSPPTPTQQSHLPNNVLQMHIWVLWELEPDSQNRKKYIQTDGHPPWREMLWVKWNPIYTNSYLMCFYWMNPFGLSDSNDSELLNTKGVSASEECQSFLAGPLICEKVISCEEKLFLSRRLLILFD